MRQQNQGNPNDRENRGRSRREDEGRFQGSSYDRGGPEPDPEREARGFPSTEWEDRDHVSRRAAEPWPEQERDYGRRRHEDREDELGRRTYGDQGRQSYGSPIGGSREMRGWEDQGRGWGGERQGSRGLGYGGYGGYAGIGGQDQGGLGSGGSDIRRRPEYMGKGPKGYTRSDERIKEAVSDRLSEGYLDASDIEVTVTGGEVTLTGFVPDKSSRRWAEDVLEGIPGVKDVENRLKVKREEGSASAGQGADSRSKSKYTS